MEPLAFMFLAFTAGSFWGSFLGVVAVRVPEGESILFPGSRCDSCKNPLRIQEMIPIISWILLKGHCKSCHRPIPFEVPLSELATACFSGILLLLKLPFFHTIVLCLFFSFALPLTLIDIRSRRLPHILTLSAIAVGILLSSHSAGEHGLLLSVAGALLGFIPVATVATLYSRGIGMGDAFWLAAIGAFAGPESLPLVLLIASGTGIAAALLLRAFHPSFRNQSLLGLALPFGPFLSVGGLMVLLIPDVLLNFTRFL